MSQYAKVYLGIRTIAWLVPVDNWQIIEQVILYNCAIRGGFYNSIVPVQADGTISAVYEDFLRHYDPDLIVLGTDQRSTKLDQFISSKPSFGVVPWSKVSEIVSADPYQAIMNTEKNLPQQRLSNYPSSSWPLVAVESDEFPDTSRLALVICGDVGSARTFNISGYREEFLTGLNLNPNENPNWQLKSVDFLFDKSGQKSSRKALNQSVFDTYKFPLKGIKAILCICQAKR